jgi:hypothetical protein
MQLQCRHPQEKESVKRQSKGWGRHLFAPSLSPRSFSAQNQAWDSQKMSKHAGSWQRGGLYRGSATNADGNASASLQWQQRERDDKCTLHHPQRNKPNLQKKMACLKQLQPTRPAETSELYWIIMSNDWQTPLGRGRSPKMPSAHMMMCFIV